MTTPELGGSAEFATQEDLRHLYDTTALACVALGEWFDPRLPGLVQNQNSPYPRGAFFEVQRTAEEIAAYGSVPLGELAERWELSRITVQYMSEHKRSILARSGVEYVPGSVSFLMERRDGTEDVYLMENRYVNGAWVKLTDRLDNQSPIDDLRDHELAFTRDETDELAYFAGHVARLPRHRDQQ